MRCSRCGSEIGETSPPTYLEKTTTSFSGEVNVELLCSKCTNFTLHLGYALPDGDIKSLKSEIKTKE